MNAVATQQTAPDRRAAVRPAIEAEKVHFSVLNCWAADTVDIRQYQTFQNKLGVELTVCGV